MAARTSFLRVFFISVMLTLSVIPKDGRALHLNNLQHHLKDKPWDPQLMLQTVKTYVAWGSLEGKLTPNCSRFDDIFDGNKTWTSPFVVPNGFVFLFIEKSCQELADNLTWHSGSLQAGHYIYPHYDSQATRPYKVAFVWTAVGGSNYREIFGLKSYDFTIISTFLLYNETAIFMAKDIFMPEGKDKIPDTIMTMIDQYMSLMDGDCKNFPDIFWEDNGFIMPSGSSKDFYGTKEITAYCDMMMYEWSSYVYHLHHVTYLVSRSEDVVDEVTFTWTRTGLHLGEVRTEEVLTELSLLADNTPLKALKISEALDYFEPHDLKA